MKKILTLVILLNTLLLASNNAKENDTQRKSRIDKQIQIEMEKEKKYSKEQTFYSGKEYDFKGAEVNKDSLDSVPEIPVDDFNIDSVYD
ncbi:MAG: hypothetical protein U9N33_11825 [Campylobacterota bacterium]|nr:hypothetical protein [Campylobacterota bacterium]